MSQAMSPSRPRKGHHRRTSALVSSSSSAAMGLADQSPSTTTINSVALDAASNPLLQPDITPADLLTQYTPAQLSGHLSAIKSQLEVYDTELKALINSRYEDVLSVGNTITAMEGSSNNLDEALTSASSGMQLRDFTQDRDEQISSPAASASQALRTEENRVRSAAGLLLILQEAPEEIWRILDSLASGQGPSSSFDSNERTVLARVQINLKAARRLSTAVALLETIKLAEGQLRDDDISCRIFQLSLSEQAGIQASLKGEMSAYLEQIISTSSMVLSEELFSASPSSSSSSSVRAASMEANTRSIQIALVSLAILRNAEPVALSNTYLDLRSAALEAWCSKQIAAQEDAYGNVTEAAIKVLLTMAKELLEISDVHHDVFGIRHTPQPTTVRKSSTALQLVQGTESDSQELSRSKAISPVSLLNALTSLPSSQRIKASLSPDSPIRTPGAKEHNYGFSIADSQRTLHDYVEGVMARLGVSTFPALVSALDTLTSVGRCRRQLTKLLGDVASRGSPARALLSDRLRMVLCTQSSMLWREELQCWRDECLQKLELAKEATTEYSTSIYDDMFSNPGHSGSFGNRKATASPAIELQNILDGQVSGTAPFLSCISEGWKVLQSAKIRYFKYVSTSGEDLEEEEAEWVRKEREAWSSVFGAVSAELSKEAENHAVETTQTRRHLIRIATSLLYLPKFVTATHLSFQGQEEAFHSLRSSISEARHAAIVSWKSDSVVDAALDTWSKGLEAEGSAGLLPSGADAEKPSAPLLQMLFFIGGRCDEISIPSLSGLHQPESTDGDKASIDDVGSVTDLLRDLHAKMQSTLPSVNLQSANPVERIAKQDVKLVQWLIEASSATNLQEIKTLRESAQAKSFAPFALFLGHLPFLFGETTPASVSKNVVGDDVPPTSLPLLLRLAGRGRTQGSTTVEGTTGVEVR